MCCAAFGAEPSLTAKDSQLNRADGWWLSVMGRFEAPGGDISKAAASVVILSPGIFEATDTSTFNTTRPSLQWIVLGCISGLIRAPSILRRDCRNPCVSSWSCGAGAGLIASANLANLNALLGEHARQRMAWDGGLSA